MQVGSTPPFVLAWTCLYAATILLFVRQRLRLKRVDLLFLLAGLFVVLSAFWSSNPLRSGIYGALLLMNALFVSQLIRKFDADTFVRLVVDTITLLCVIGLTLHIAGAELVSYYDPHGRTTIVGTDPIRGLFNHKITAGLYTAIGFALATATLSGLRKWFTCGVLLVFNVLTGSATGHFALVAGWSLSCVVRASLARRFSPTVFSTLLLLAILMIGPIMWLALPTLLEFLGRDPTLTGRTLLWAWGIDAGMQRPWLGWGYVGYIGSAEAIMYAQRLQRFVNYEVPHFHNSYVQAFVELGALGVVAYIFVLFMAMKRTYEAALKTRSRGFTGLAIIIPLIACAGMFMNLFIKYNSFVTMILLYSWLIYRPRSRAAEGITAVRRVSSPRLAIQRPVLERL